MLQGIRVIDFPRITMGPTCTKYFSDFGAEVIRIESSRAPDVLREYLPYRNGTPGVNRSCFFAWINSSKLSITLNLKKPEGQLIVKRLIACSDVVFENMTQGTMASLGLSYEDLSKINPRIIMLSASGLGQNGPYHKIHAAGNFIQGMAGFYNLLGEPGWDPVIPFLPYPDFLGAQFGVIAILSSLIYREKTGKGQFIDLSMLESSLSVIAPEILDYIVNNQETTPNGNHCTYAAPHGVYRCAGLDRWCAVSVFNDDEWTKLKNAIGNPDWANNPYFSSVIGRKENENELDRNLENWTVNRTPEEIVEILQKAGIAAAVVQNGKDLVSDPQLKYRGYLRIVDGHCEIGSHYTETPAFTLSKTPPQIGPAPCLGEDNNYVFKDILGMEVDEINRLHDIGVIQ